MPWLASGTGRQPLQSEKESQGPVGAVSLWERWEQSCTSQNTERLMLLVAEAVSCGKMS